MAHNLLVLRRLYLSCLEHNLFFFFFFFFNKLCNHGQFVLAFHFFFSFLSFFLFFFLLCHYSPFEDLLL